MKRRGFLGGLAGVLAAGFAPAAIGSGVLMPVRQVVTASDHWQMDNLERLDRATELEAQMRGMQDHMADAFSYSIAAQMREWQREQNRLLRDLVDAGVLQVRGRGAPPYILMRDG